MHGTIVLFLRSNMTQWFINRCNIDKISSHCVILGLKIDTMPCVGDVQNIKQPADSHKLSAGCYLTDCCSIKYLLILLFVPEEVIL